MILRTVFSLLMKYGSTTVPSNQNKQPWSVGERGSCTSQAGKVLVTIFKESVAIFLKDFHHESEQSMLPSIARFWNCLLYTSRCV